MTDVKVLIPLDGSQLAERALAYVPALARLGKLAVRLFAVAEPDEDGKQTAAEHVERVARPLAAYLDERAATIAGPDVAVDCRVTTSRQPASAILAESQSWEAGLIAISTHGRSGVQRWRLGSVADKVVRGARCDTLIIGPHADVEAAITAVLVPLDGSDTAEKALPVARRVAQALGAQIHVVRAAQPPTLMTDGFGYTYYPELLDSVNAEAESYIEEVKSRFPEVRAASVPGYPSDVLLDYVERNAVGLVVMTSHGRGGVVRTALGSVTDRMLGGPAPVFVVRSAGCREEGVH